MLREQMAETSEVKSDDSIDISRKIVAMGDDAKPGKGLQQDQHDQDDDLEDGEIETDDDEPIVTVVQSPVAVEPPKSKKFKSDPSPGYGELSEKPTKSYPSVKSSRKFSRGGVVEDDWAENIENAIAAALKKDGIEPSRPEFKKRDDAPEEPPPSKNKSRKRKKRDQEKEKNKKKKHVHEEQTVIESDIDENEMLCIRGASPPLLMSGGRIGVLPPPPDDHPPAPSYYESDGSYSSYETEDSIEYRKPYEEKRQNRRNKDRRQRKGGGRGGGGGGGTASDKRRNREESDGVCIDYLRGACNNDDCPRSHDGRAQRKLELCKFYLMECCAKKEKCLYMHADFPCKYYYLGMECVYKGNCKFSHGKPLTDQLRNILLKHIETAPKEILGNFRRISRENAVALMNTAHAKICDEHGIENTLATSMTTSTITTTTATSSAGTSSTSSLSKQSNSASETSSSIPSLLDMVIKPPAISPRKEDKDKMAKGEKTRKSRWCDSQQGNSSSNMAPPPPQQHQHQQHHQQQQQQQQSSNSGGSGAGGIPASFLNLKNLTGVITSDQIEKLESLGIENLEQVNQLTVAQLNNIGLTISQINEIQLNALNIQKLGLIGTNSTTSAGQQTQSGANMNFSPSDPKSVVNQDIDMRFLVAPPKMSSPGQYPAASSSTISSSNDPDKMQTSNVRFSDTDIASPEPTPNYGDIKSFPPSDSRSNDLRSTESTTGAAINSSIVDYSQYLKDAHIDADKIDLNNIALDKDDEALIEDEPELLIDESWCPSEDEYAKDSKNDDGEDNWDDDEDRAESSKSKSHKTGENGRNDWESRDSDHANKQEDLEEDWSVCAPASDSQQPSQDFCDENWDDDLDRPTPTTTTTTTTKEDEYYNQSTKDSWDNRRNYSKFRQTSNEDDSWGSSDNNKPQSGSGGFYSQQQDVQQNWGGYNRMYQTGPSYFQQHPQMHQQYHPTQQQCQPYEQQQQPVDDEENWDDDLDQNQHQHHLQKMDPRSDSYHAHAPMPAIYDPKSLMPSSITSKIDISASVSSLMGMPPMPQSSTNQTYMDACGLIQDRVENEAKSSPQSADPREFRGDPRLFKSMQQQQQQQQQHQHQYEDSFSTGIRSPPVHFRTSLDLPKYDRISIYDGTPRTLDDEQTSSRKSDKDMRVSGFLDPNKSDIDLRLPFKRVMTNYTPATEIDGSISSHPPIPYKVVEIEIPKPDYSEIRRSVPVTDKTLDPRLRRIFCLKESIDGDGESSASFLSSLSRQTTETEKSSLAAVLGGPRVDPRRKKDNPDMFSAVSSSSSSGGGMQQQGPPAASKTLDIRMLLQKSDWYKNLNSKVKIMVNQQLALVSTELKKFHQDPSPNKVFDIQFIVSNQYLQQILTNLGIYIDDYGEVRQLENETDEGAAGVGGGGQGPPMPGMMGMRMGMMDGGLGGAAPGGMPMGQGPPPMMPMDFLRGPPPMNAAAAAAAAAMQQRFMGGMMPFGGPPKPGLLGIAPGVGYNPFDAPNPNCGGGSSGDGNFPPSGQGGGYDGSDGNMFGGAGGGGGGGNNFPGSVGGNFYRSGNRGKNDGNGGNSGGGSGGNRGNRNFRGGAGSGNNSRNNDRWGGNSGPRNESGGGGGNRRNYDNNRGGGRGGGGRDRGDSRRDKM